MFMLTGQAARWVLAIGVSLLLFFAWTAAGPADAHRSGCHSHHTCPSDRATYRWHGKLCLSPKNGGSSSNGGRVRYGGYTYYCHR